MAFGLSATLYLLAHYMFFEVDGVNGVLQLTILIGFLSPLSVVCFFIIFE